MAKKKTTLFLSDDVLRLLAGYAARHPGYATTSQAADHLLRQALRQDLGEACEELLSAPLRAAIGHELASVLQRCFPGVEPQLASDSGGRAGGATEVSE